MPEIVSTLGVAWGGGAAVVGDPVALAWGSGASLYSTGGPFTAGEPPVGGTPIEPNTDARLTIAQRGIYNQVNVFSVEDVRDGLPVKVESLTLRADRDSVMWTMTATGTSALYEKVKGGVQPAVLRVDLNGQQWVFEVTQATRSRKHGVVDVSIQGSSVTASAGEPVQLERNWVNEGDSSASELAISAAADAGLDLLWGVGDWVIPSGVFSFAGTPLGVVKRIAEAVGAVVQSDPLEPQLQVLPRYPLLPNEWPLVPPDVEIAVDALESEAFTRNDKPAYDGVYVGGQAQGVQAFVRLAGTSGANLAPQVVDPLLTEAIACEQRGTAILGAGGKQQQHTLVGPALTGEGEPGVMRVGWLVRVVEPAETWYGQIASVSVTVNFPEAVQTIVVERHTEPLAGTELPPLDLTALVFLGPIPELIGVVGEAFAFALSPYWAGGEGERLWFLRSGALPDGLLLGLSTGVVSGTPTTPQEPAPIAFRAVDEINNQADSATTTFRVVPPVAFIGPALGTQNLTVGTPFSLDLAPLFEGGFGTTTYAIATGSLPAGVDLDTGTGLVSGTPTVPGSIAGVSFSQSREYGGSDVTDSVTFTTVTSAPPPPPPPPPPPAPLYFTPTDAGDITFTYQYSGSNPHPVNSELSAFAQGGSGSYTFSKVSEAGGTGVTTTVSSGGVLQVTDETFYGPTTTLVVRCTDGTTTIDREISIPAYSGSWPAPKFNGPIPRTSVTSGTSVSLSCASYFDYAAATSYELVAGSLASTGLSLNTATGAITGTRTTGGSTAALVVRAIGPAGTIRSNEFSI